MCSTDFVTAKYKSSQIHEDCAEIYVFIQSWNETYVILISSSLEEFPEFAFMRHISLVYLSQTFL